MASYNTSDFRKGLKVQIDGDPYLMIECNFVKPGKGNADRSSVWWMWSSSHVVNRRRVSVAARNGGRCTFAF